jgi:ATP-dependent DNA helicase PIF1
MFRKVTTEVGIATDEIERFINTRYMLVHQKLRGASSNFLCMVNHILLSSYLIHLPNKQSVFFRRGEEVAAVEKALAKRTQLEGYFLLNSQDDYAKQFTYDQIPLHYCWIVKTAKWQLRRRKMKVVTRLVNVSPRDVERYHLRILLLLVPGPTSYDSLKTAPDGTVCSTFLEACNKRHLLDNDTVWVETLNDAVLSDSPKQLRRLFAYMLLYCNISDPLFLYTQFVFDLCQDYSFGNRSDDEAQQRALYKIECILRSSSS